MDSIFDETTTSLRCDYPCNGLVTTVCVPKSSLVVHWRDSPTLMVWHLDTMLDPLQQNRETQKKVEDHTMQWYAMMLFWKDNW